MDPDAKYKVLGYAFDIISGVVSLLDLSTDLIILVTWYIEDRMIFFWISIVILFIAQCSYLILFYFNHGACNDGFHGKWQGILSFCGTIPFAPILSFIFHFTADLLIIIFHVIILIIIQNIIMMNKVYNEPNLI